MSSGSEGRNLRNLIRNGLVTAVSGTSVRVYFDDIDLATAYLPVLQHGDDPWVPNINDRVLVVYLPDSGGDGYVLGVIDK